MSDAEKLKVVQMKHFGKRVKRKEDQALMVAGWQAGFEAMMEGACQMLKFLGGQISYTYTTTTGCKIQMILQNP